MSSFWHSKNSPEQGAQQQQEGHDDRPSQHHEEPDERTTLLPRPGSGYLSPDDPAVSPYNLWSIRVLRGLSSLFLAITFVWWTFLLVSIFVSPPGMHTRGSGFFDFAYTSLTLAYLLLSLLCFTVPSRPMAITGAVLFLLLFIDIFIIVGVPRLRLEEGWVGIASVVWATLIAGYNVLQTRSVAWGKREEEERLTGREETRRPLREWLAVLLETVAMVIFAIVALLFTATLIVRARDATLRMPGKTYPVNGDSFRVHLACVGDNTTSSAGGIYDGEKPPTVLIEGNSGAVEHTLQPFIDDAYSRGDIARYCYWDRPGYGWSDNAPSPYSAGMAADALSEALALAGEEGPWVLVSAGIGGIYSRIFASRHVLEISGIMLIDALHEEYLGDIAAPGRGFVLWLRGVVSPLGFDRVFGAMFKGRTREDRVYGRSAYQGGRVIKARLQENLVAGTMTASEIQTARHVQQAETSLVVVSSGVEVHRSERWAKAQEKLTTVTRNLKQWDIVKGAPHEVWKTVEGRQVLEKRLRELVRGEDE